MPRPKQLVRYAVVGLGHIDQSAVLPAFEHVRENSELVALVSDDPQKLAVLGSVYEAARLIRYDEYDAFLDSDEIDAVYIGLPNALHADYAIRALRRGIHVLCEKPMAIGAEPSREMVMAARDSGARLMVAYRLHFEPANLRAIEVARSGRIGEARLFSSEFTFQVRPGDIRTSARLGGGALYDIGIYCINAARYIFRDEPTEVFAWDGRSGDPRFAEVDESVGGLMRFPGGRLASFLVSLGAADASSYRVIGTAGDLRVEPAYDYGSELRHRLTAGGVTEEQVFPRGDQFAAEIAYFSGCILAGREPEPSGREGLIDVTIIEAMRRSIRHGQPIQVKFDLPDALPVPAQEIAKPAPARDPVLVNVEGPSRR